MPFIKRDENGRILALLRAAEPDATEHLPVDHPQVMDFLGENDFGSRHKVEMRQSDLDVIRVFEDLIDILLERKLILLTDFPQPAQEKLLRRKSLRAALTPIADVLAVEEDGIL